MRNLKKFLALVLAMMMALSLMVTVNAKDVVSEFPDTDTIIDEFYEDVTVLAGMGVIKGHADTGTFAPQTPVTRAQMAAIVYRLATGDAADLRSDLYKAYQKFSDVTSDAWYAGYVGYCADAGYIQGYPNGTFKPNEPVTGYAALAMVLRAMGYNQPGYNFTGATWRAETGSTATQRGMLVNVNKSIYAGTLNQPASRELVAEIAFQAASPDHPMVQWTNAFGYQTTGMRWDNTNNGVTTSTQNPSLGQLYYGLESKTRVVVGNQATGENCTLLAPGGGQDYTDSGNSAAYADFTYAYPGDEVVNSSGVKSGDPAINAPTGTKLTGDLGKTGLDLFGHMVTAWYDKDTDGAGRHNTYAVFDRAELAKVVNSPLGTTDTATAEDSATLSSAAKTNALLGIRAQAVGFSVNLETSQAHTSNSYGKIAATTSRTAATPTAPTRAAGYGMYALISNSSDKRVDVIVTLNAEVAQIIQKDTISSARTLTLGNGGFGASNNGVLKMNSITADSETNLGSKVVAWKIIGTNSSNSNLPLYQLDKVTKVETGTVRTYDGNGAITFTDGRTVEKSWLYTQIKSGFDTPDPFLAGVTYTLALDNDGRWLGVTTSPGEFVYATYGDYEVGALGTGTIKYTVTGIDWNGDKVVNEEISSITIPVQSGDPAEFGFEQFKAGPAIKNYPSVNDGALANGYNLLPITKKDQGQAQGGNRIEQGQYTGFLLDGNGALTATNGANDLNGNLGDGSIRLQGAGAVDFTITTQDAANGFKSLYNNVDDAYYGKLMLTNDTRFIVVSGTGTADLHADVYTGLTDFLNGAAWVKLDLSEGADYTYYKVGGDLFNKWDVTSSNGLVTDIIMGLDDLTFYGVNDLYYKFSAGATGVKLAGVTDSNVKQFVLYKDGEPSTYFVDCGVAAGKPTYDLDYNGEGFFNLIKAYEVNGTPVYYANAAKAGPAAEGNLCDWGLGYEYVSVNNLNTARFTDSGPSNITEILNVTNAKVVDVEYNALTCTHDKIDSLAKLNAAVSGLDRYSGGIKVAIVNNGLNVSVIYVTTVPGLS